MEFLILKCYINQKIKGMYRKVVFIGVGAVVLASCSLSSQNKNDKAENEDLVDSVKYSVNFEYFDESVRPQDDFFLFANGQWLKDNPVPASESRWGSFNELDETNKEKLTTILENAMNSDAEKGSTHQLIGDYYAAYMNTDLRNEQSADQVKAIFREIDKINSKDQLASVLKDLHSKGISAFYRFRVGQDLKNVDKHIPYFSQGGIGLPNRDYYFEENKKDVLEAYKKHIIDVLKQTGEVTNPEKSMQKAVKLETALATKMMKPAELRSPENTYNPTKRTTLIKTISPFDIEGYFSKTGIESFDTIIVGQPLYVKELSRIIKETSLEDIKAYLTWRMMNHYSKYLGEDYVQLHFDFYKTTLSGTKEMKPLNERAIDEMTRSKVSQALGEAFVEEHFSEEAKDKVNEMVDHLLTVYRKRLKSLDWMSEETKAEALKKLEAIGRKLGFPDEFKDLSDLDIVSDDYLANIDNSKQYAFKENIEKLNEPVDKDEWGMPAHMVNAYYHPLLNEIAFPAGIMQPPFFDIKAEDAVNYGGIGMVIGHEFTHGFDDEGSKFAADGSYNNWWKDEDRSRFEERTKKLGDTYASFCPIEGHCVNPELTMGENIADLGGLAMAYYAYAMTDEYQSGEEINGFTPSQRFFIAYAQLWKTNYTEEELKKRIAIDPHSPGMYRVNGPLMNSPEFFKAFDVKEEDPMRNPSDKISEIW